MAASAPAANKLPWNDIPDSTASLEIGMSGMSLVSSVPDGHVRNTTGSTVSSASTIVEEFPGRQAPTSSSEQGKTATEVDPGTPPREAQQEPAAKNRLPGLPATAPSPGGKPGHSKNNSATSSMITLTPSSSLDGNSEWHNAGARQSSSPFHGSADVPPLPYLTSENRPGEDSARHGESSARFDRNSDLEQNDGLLGLDALRDRSSPVPPAPSPRGQFPPHGLGAQLETGHERSRMHPRDRPPLSQPYAEGNSPHQGERNLGNGSTISFGASGRGGGSSNSEANNISMESVESRGSLGVIGRPESWQQVSEYDTRMRASASDVYYQGHNAFSQQGAAADPVAQRFGSLPSLGNHMQHQTLGEIPRPRHQRSVSHGTGHSMASNGESRYFHSNSSTLPQDGFRSSSVQRTTSLTHSGVPGYEGGHYASSVPSLNGGQIAYQQFNYQALQRREALDFHYSGPGSVGSDDCRGLSSARMISPAPSPLHSHYSGHSRQASEASSVLLSSSPLSTSSARGLPRQHVPGDEDLAHPLMGEHIEVPADVDDQYGLSNPYVMNPMRNATHQHSMSADGMHFHEATRHLPTAGSALPLPNVVYSVKFKKTQRNFVLGPRVNRDFQIGTYVKVEADRGEDLGIVVGKMPADRYNFAGRANLTAGMTPPGGLGSAADLKRIIRLATHDEVSLLTIKREEEEELLKICRAKVRQRGLPMNVVDAEYQFDRHKLTFFFEAEGRVDFRELVRDLFSMYKTRIWMQQLDKNTSTSAQSMMSTQASNLQMDNGTPIIAPASEFADSIFLGGLPGADGRTH